MGPFARSYWRHLAAAARRRGSSARGNTSNKTRKEKEGERGQTGGSCYWDPIFSTWALGTAGSSGLLYTYLRDYVDKSIELSREQTLNIIIKLENEKILKEQKVVIAQADNEKAKKKTGWFLW